ncbi:MAG TPA: hypothetical protein VD887_12720 [Allosphingosinicella sp.]|nr:hypothetical protein [Allosphingosinicella sp.]
MIRSLAALSLILAPAAAAAQKPPETAAPPRVIEGADPSIWQGDAETGPIVQRESGIALPERFGNFRRVRVGGLSSTDAFANYRYVRENGGSSLVTVMLFRPGTLPEHRLPISVAAISVRTPQAFLWTDGPFLVGSTPELRGYKAAFKTGIGPDTVMDYLYFFPLGGWTVKVRATVASPTDIEHEREVDALVRGLPWDQVLRAAGTCSGWACRLDRAFPFNSHISEGMPELVLGRGPSPAPVYSAHGYRLIPVSDRTLPHVMEQTFGSVNVRAPLFAVENGSGRDRRVHRFFSGQPTEAQFERTVGMLREHPEPGPLVSPIEAAWHLGLLE